MLYQEGGRTEFHDPKVHNPRELDPNATGKRVASKQVDEDSTGDRRQGNASGMEWLEGIAVFRRGLTWGRPIEDQTLPGISYRQRFWLYIAYVEVVSQVDMTIDRRS